MMRGFVNSPDGQIHYRDMGGSGAPVIVLHQTPESSRGMAPVAQAIGDHGFRAIAMDTMGYGDSDRPPVPYTSMSEFARAVSWLITGLGFEKAHLVGVLTGSQIGLQTAAEYPDLIESLVTQEAFNWGTDSRRAVHERIHRFHPPRADGGHLIELWDRSNWTPDDQRAHDVRMRDFLAVNEETGAEVYGGMGWEGAAPYSMCRTVIWDVTPKIQAPVLFTYRDHSQLDRALDRFLETTPRGKGLRDAPSFASDPAGFAKVATDFFRTSGK